MDLIWKAIVWLDRWVNDKLLHASGFAMNAGRSTTATSTPHAISIQPGGRKSKGVRHETAQSGISGHQSSGASRWNPRHLCRGGRQVEMQTLAAAIRAESDAGLVTLAAVWGELNRHSARMDGLEAKHRP